MTAAARDESAQDDDSTIGQGWVVVAPTFNHGGALGAVLRSLAWQNLPIIVVNDGATDGTASVLAEWLGTGEGGPVRIVVTHGSNQGKAAAIRSGFAEAARLGYSHALTIDTDGQHDAADLVSLMRMSVRQRESLIIGARTTSGEAVPLASRIGRSLSNWFVWLESGVRVSDSQSGMRAYPLAHMHVLTGHSSRYGFETEVIVRSGWYGLSVIETPIRCIYEVPGGRTTHFCLWWDTLASIRMHAVLCTRALFPGPGRINSASAPQTGTIPGRLARWFSPRKLLEMASGDAASRDRLAASVGVGLLMATLPVYGIKTVACLWLSARFRLHPLAVISISSLSTPPLGFVFVALSIGAGGLLLNGKLPDLSAISLTTATQWSTFNSLLAEWLLGSVIAGLVLGVAGHTFVRAVLNTTSHPLPAQDGRATRERR
jgi:uncharacterized protein (DUF2062 family)